MKRLLILLALLFSTPALSQTQQLCYTSNGSNCIKAVAAALSKPINIAAATTTEIVPLLTGSKIFITSFDLMAAGANNVTLVYGTGTNCGTGTVSLTGAYPLIAQAGIAKGNGTGAILFIPISNALCVTTSGGGQLSGSISYVQF